MLLCMVTIVVAIGLLSRVKLTDVYKDKSLLIYNVSYGHGYSEVSVCMEILLGHQND